MTDQSRVEAVADVLARELGYHRVQMIRLAEDVIEASDAWLVEQVAAEADKQIADRHEPEDTDR